MERITDELIHINDRMESLECIFGIREDISSKKIAKLRFFFMHNNFTDCIQEIARMMEMPMQLNINLVEESLDRFVDEQKNHLPNDACVQLYHILRLITVLEKDKRVAWIYIPDDLPRFGSPELESQKINMTVKRSITYEPFETFVFCISHEIAHVLLKLGGFNPKNEINAELLPMLLGFSEFYKSGRTSKISRHTYGYLSYAQFLHASKKIGEMQEKELGKSFPKIMKRMLKRIFS